MADEQIIFKGNPSPVSIFGSLVLSFIAFAGLSAGLIHFWTQFPQGTLRHLLFWVPLIPLLFFFGKWMALNFITYEITSERIKVIKGIFSKRTDELELYRVKDTSLVEPFIYRMFSAGNIVIVTNDASTPTVELRAIKNAKEVREQLRASVEECRARKRAGIVELE
jgi:uncharacterized membrane protein YdbT with pleckstrin-like domain